MQKGELYTARLTLDVTPAMRARIKVSAFNSNATVTELLRALLEREFPEPDVLKPQVSEAEIPETGA